MLPDQFPSSSQPQTVNRASVDLQQIFNRSSINHQQNSFLSNHAVEVLIQLEHNPTWPHEIQWLPDTLYKAYMQCKVVMGHLNIGPSVCLRQTGNQRTSIYLDWLTVMRCHDLSCGFKRRRHGGHLDSHRGRVCGKLWLPLTSLRCRIPSVPILSNRIVQHDIIIRLLSC